MVRVISELLTSWPPNSDKFLLLGPHDVATATSMFSDKGYVHKADLPLAL